LEYHFATQCIPTPLAWWFQQLPPLFLRWGVAFTLVVELPVPFLILAPLASVRRLGALLVAGLMVRSSEILLFSLSQSRAHAFL